MSHTCVAYILDLDQAFFIFIFDQITYVLTTL